MVVSLVAYFFGPPCTHIAINNRFIALMLWDRSQSTGPGVELQHVGLMIE